MRISVFAVEDDAAQVCWSQIERTELRLEAGPAAVTIETDGRPGATQLRGLSPSTTFELLAGVGGGPLRKVAHFATLASPPGSLRCKFATVNDIHIGAIAFGTLHPQFDDGTLEPHPVRCARAALAEAREWGAGFLVAKGDLTQDGRPEEWHTAGRLIQDSGMPALVVEGNHDVKKKAVDGGRFLAAYGIPLYHRAGAVDLPGVRIVALPTAAWHSDDGTIHPDDRRAALELVSSAPEAAVIAMHYYPQRFRWPNLYPTGIPGPLAERFLDEVAEANPRTIVLSGHSHRHRRHHHGPLVVAEVGSTKDYPGSWAGYAVHEGGIRQVTLRVAEPTAMAWTEAGRKVLGGVWGRWAPGLRSHRCFTVDWPPLQPRSGSACP